MGKLTQEFEALLNGRSIRDLTGSEASTAVDMLTEIVKSKSLKTLTKTELKALVEELTEIVALNMFKGDIPDDWKTQILNKFESSPERRWGWNWASIMDLHLHNVEMWDDLSAEEREVVARAIVKFLQEAVV